MELYQHQREIADEVLDRQKLCVWAETGVGKTAAVLTALEESVPLREGPALVLCPLSIVETAWVQDAQRFAPSLVLAPAVGSKKVRERVLNGLGFAGADTVVVMNYEGYRASHLLVDQIRWSMVVLDESTKIKNPSTKISKLVGRLVARSPWVVPMSGCPAPNHEQEFYSQVMAVDGASFPPTFGAFRHRFFYQPRPEILSWLWKMRSDMREEFFDTVQRTSFMVRKDECLDLPEQVFETLEVPLQREERRLYDQFLRDLVLRFDRGDVVGTTARAELMKLRQMTAGFARTTEGEWLEIGNSKLKELVSLMESVTRRPDGSRKPVVVAGQFRVELERIVATLRKEKYTVGLIYGGTPISDRTQYVNDFQDGRLDVLVGHPASMGHGLTLTRASDMILCSLDHSYELYFQLLQRIHRIGQGDRCTYYRLVGTDTVDQDVLACLDRKENLEANVVEEILRRQQKRVA